MLLKNYFPTKSISVLLLALVACVALTASSRTASATDVLLVGADSQSKLEAVQADLGATGMFGTIDTFLDAKLNNVLDAWLAVQSGDRPDVVNKLDAYINQVEAQQGKLISESDPDVLIDAANEISGRILEEAL
jgi:hypothetical protein